MKAFSFKLALFALFSILSAPASHSYELLGLISYNFSQVTPAAAVYSSTKNEIGYTFLGRVDFGPGLVETGFEFIPTSITTNQSFGPAVATGNYWILPLMYRYIFLPPFLSAAIGLDYAVCGSSLLSVSGSQANGITSGYKSHFGAEVSLEANQDLGENLSLALDFRYRQGLAPAISFNNVGSNYNFLIIALGIQKHLE